jgi:hypothetical protein
MTFENTHKTLLPESQKANANATSLPPLSTAAPLQPTTNHNHDNLKLATFFMVLFLNRSQARMRAVRLCCPRVKRQGTRTQSHVGHLPQRWVSQGTLNRLQHRS